MFEWHAEFDIEDIEYEAYNYIENTDEDTNEDTEISYETELFNVIENHEEFDRLLTKNRSLININTCLRKATPHDSHFRTECYSNGPGFLHLATYKNQIRIVKRLLKEHDLEINLFTADFMCNALIIAAAYGRDEIAKLLIDHGIDINHGCCEFEPNNDQPPNSTSYRTPLHHACKNNHLGIVRMLLQLPGIDINKAQNLRAFIDLPLRASIINHQIEPENPIPQEITQLLLQAGAGIHQNLILPSGIRNPDPAADSFSSIVIDWSTNRWEAINTDGIVLIGFKLTYYSKNTLIAVPISRETPGFEKAIFTEEQLIQAYENGELKSDLKSLQNLCRVELEKNPENNNFKELNAILNRLPKKLFSLCAGFFNKPEHAVLKKALIEKFSNNTDIKERLEELWQEENNKPKSVSNVNNPRLVT